jgi:1,4-dihydroxy-2-naphthoate octaprenyltransferase
MTFLTIIIFGIMNRLRGYDPSDYNPTTINKVIGKITNKIVTSILSGAALYLLTQDIVLCLITAVGILIWSIPGWGDYFDFTHTKNNENKIIDKITSKINSAKVKDTVAMSLRGLFILPLFIGFSVYLQSFAPLVAAPLILLQGPTYLLSLKIVPDFGYNHALAEFLTGLLIGIMVLLAL